MAELAAEGPFQGAGLPYSAGGTTLDALPTVARAAIAPFAGKRATVSETLRAQIGVGLPEPGRAEGAVTWAGMGQWLVEGRDAGEVAAWLRGLAAVTDQSDAWVGLTLAGAAAEVLARLVPLDLADLRPGSAARSLLRHVPLLIVATPAGFDLLVPRSYAATAVRELAETMRAVAARTAL